MKLKIKILDERVRDLYENHGHFHQGDAGLDLFMVCDFYCAGERRSPVIGLGIAVEPDQSFLVVPRSSISKTPLSLANSLGIIDKGYRGELKVCFDNPYRFGYKWEAGHRLVQIIAPDLEPIEFEIVDELDETSRGDGGHGSTGK